MTDDSSFAEDRCASSSEGSSLLSDVPAKHKLLAAFIFTCAAVVLAAPAAIFAALGCAFAAALLLRPPLRRLLPSLRRLNIFLLFLVCTMPLSLSPAGALFTLGPLFFTKAGLTQALFACAKANAALLVFLLLPGSSSFALNCKALRETGVPEKLVTLLQLTARNIAAFRRELSALYNAAALRGFTPKAHPRTYKTTAFLAAMLLIRSFDKSRRAEQAMRLRGFTGKIPSFAPAENASASKGRALIICSCLAAALLLLLNFPPHSL